MATTWRVDSPKGTQSRFFTEVTESAALAVKTHTDRGELRAHKAFGPWIDREDLAVVSWFVPKLRMPRDLRYPRADPVFSLGTGGLRNSSNPPGSLDHLAYRLVQGARSRADPVIRCFFRENRFRLLPINESISHAAASLIEEHALSAGSFLASK